MIFPETRLLVVKSTEIDEEVVAETGKQSYNCMLEHQIQTQFKKHECRALI